MAPIDFRGPKWLIKMTTAAGTIATVASLTLLYLDVTGRLARFDETAVIWTDTVLCLIMLAEWFVLLRFADRKGAYLRARWLELIASIPLMLILRPFRVVRLLRLLRLVRVIGFAGRMLSPWRKALASPVLRSAAWAACAVILLGAVAVMDIEKTNEGLDTFPEALWWALVTATTVGYGDAYPVTAGGRFVAAALMILGIAFFGAFTAALTTATESEEDEGQPTNQDIIERLEAMEEHLAALGKSRG